MRRVDDRLFVVPLRARNAKRHLLSRENKFNLGVDMLGFLGSPANGSMYIRGPNVTNQSFKLPFFSGLTKSLAADPGSVPGMSMDVREMLLVLATSHVPSSARASVCLTIDNIFPFLP